MEEKSKLVRVSFWVDRNLRVEIQEFANTLNLSASDLYKAGAIVLKQILQAEHEIQVNLFTRSFKDFENKQLQKKIQKAYKGSKSVY